MAKKVIIIILVFLVVISGGLGAYSYLLGQQIEALSGQLSVFQQEQSSRLGAVGDELSAFRMQTTARINALKDDMGGTWRENTYPGIACDVPSHAYTYSFEPNPNWSSHFPSGDEIQA